MIQRLENIPRNGDTVVFRINRSSRHISHEVICRRLSSGAKMEICLQSLGTITAEYSSALLDKLRRDWSTNMEQAFERNLVSSRQCCSSQGGHSVPEIPRYSLWSSGTLELLTWFAPSDYWVFPEYKKHFSGKKHFSETKFSNENATLAAETKEFFLAGLTFWRLNVF
jgi:hypothetical protein